MERPRWAEPVLTRSRLVLEVASELVAQRGIGTRQARIQLRAQGGHNPWALCLFGSDTPSAIDDVAKGEAQLAIINPAEPLTLALRGTGPFKQPIPVRIITNIPSLDQFGFAVAANTGLTSLSEIREHRVPLRISMRAQPDHSTYFFVRAVFGAMGFSLEDIISWGGALRYHNFPPEVPAVERGEANAIFDEAVDSWVPRATEIGMRILPIDELVLQQLEAQGFRRATITRAQAPKLPADVPTLDFSGWPVFTLESAPDDFVRAVCAALEVRKGAIPWQGDGPLPLERMCIDAPDTPLTAPLHPAAEAFWRERGYLK